MNQIYKYALASLAVFLLAACEKDDVKEPGNPVMQYDGLPATVYFGDELPFSVVATDNQVPLSTVTAELYIEGELVDTEKVRTKTSGERYSGTVSVPYYPYAEGMSGKLRLVLQNINFTTTETEVDFVLEYPDFPYLTLKGEDGAEYTLLRSGKGTYMATDDFPSELNAVIIAPAYGVNGKQVQFGYKGDEIGQGGSGRISFRNLMDGAYSISFNARTYEFSPKGELKMDGQDLTMTSPGVYEGDFYFTAGQRIDNEGFAKLNEWDIDRDYFILEEDGSFTFNAAEGNYKVASNLSEKYFTVKPLDEMGSPAALQGDGTGTIWLMGTGVGKPDYGSHQIGWVVGNMVPFAPIGDKKFRLTFVTGKSLNPEKFTLRIFDQPGWGATFKPERITLDTQLLKIGVPGKEAHNIYLNDGVVLDNNSTYEMIVDLSAGNDAGILTFEKIN